MIIHLNYELLVEPLSRQTLTGIVMESTTEGRLLNAVCSRELLENVGPLSHSKNTEHVDLKVLPSFSRKQLVQDINHILSQIELSLLPVEIRPSIQALMNASQNCHDLGHERVLLDACKECLVQTRQGWGYLSYWTTTEQNTCYSVYWSLKGALDKHLQRMRLHSNPKNDGAPQNDAHATPPHPPKAEIHHLPGSHLTPSSSRESSILKSFIRRHLINKIKQKAKEFSSSHLCMIHQEDELVAFASVQNLKKHPLR